VLHLQSPWMKPPKCPNDKNIKAGTFLWLA